MAQFLLLVRFACTVLWPHLQCLNFEYFIFCKCTNDVFAKVSKNQSVAYINISLQCTNDVFAKISKN